MLFSRSVLTDALLPQEQLAAEDLATYAAVEKQLCMLQLIRYMTAVREVSDAAGELEMKYRALGCAIAPVEEDAPEYAAMRDRIEASVAGTTLFPATSSSGVSSSFGCFVCYCLLVCSCSPTLRRLSFACHARQWYPSGDAQPVFGVASGRGRLVSL